MFFDFTGLVSTQEVITSVAALPGVIETQIEIKMIKANNSKKLDLKGYRLRVRYNPVVVKARTILQSLERQLQPGTTLSVYNPHLEVFKTNT